MAGNKSKGAKGSGSANDQRGGIAKAQESVRNGGEDRGEGGSGAKSGGGSSGGKFAGKSGGKT